jgi:hypothetical protein
MEAVLRGLRRGRRGGLIRDQLALDEVSVALR